MSVATDAIGRNLDRPDLHFLKGKWGTRELIEIGRTVKKLGIQDLSDWDFLGLEDNWWEKSQFASEKEDDDGEEDFEDTTWLEDVIEMN